MAERRLYFDVGHFHCRLYFDVGHFHHLSPNIAQWLERLTGDLKVMGSSPAWEL